MNALKIGRKVIVNGCENPAFNGRKGIIIEVYGRSNAKAIVDVHLDGNKLGKLLYDSEYPFGVELTFTE